MQKWKKNQAINCNANNNLNESYHKDFIPRVPSFNSKQTSTYNSLMKKDLIHSKNRSILRTKEFLNIDSNEESKYSNNQSLRSNVN